jgi:4-amino-4-deoxy-L-arabinose transferase-like glycosyltransferase
MIDALRARSGEGQALRWLVALIAVVTLARLVLAATLGLGIDEAYTVATSRVLALGTFEHPPLAWWMAGGVAKLFGSEHPLIVRLPFVACGALTLALAYDAGRTLYSPHAGFFAAVVIALAPVLGWTSASMVLPDGPLLAGFLAGLCCLSRALFGDPTFAPRWWLLAGAAAGVACLSKLHGVFLLAGTGLFLLTAPPFRVWLLTPWPYLAALLAAVIASPFLIWNADHGWISFTFQASRASAKRLDLTGPFVALGGQALFLLPWVWGALALSLGRAALAGRSQPRDWLLFCCAIGPIATFTLVTLMGTKTLFHWAAPGYLFAALLLGRDLARDLSAADGRARTWLRGSSAAIAALFAIVLALAALPWPKLSVAGQPVPDPLAETRSWGVVRTILMGRQPWPTFIAGTRWHEAGRLAVALGPAVPVLCLCLDARGFGIVSDNRRYLGRDGLVIVPEGAATQAMLTLTPYFSSLVRGETLTMQGTVALVVLRGQGLRDPDARAVNLIHPFMR